MSWLIQSGICSGYSRTEGFNASWRMFGGAVLVETHTSTCNCSYCQRPTDDWPAREPELRRVGYTAPEHKSPTSWYYLHWKRPTSIWYLRWTKRGLWRMLGGG